MWNRLAKNKYNQNNESFKHANIVRCKNEAKQSVPVMF